MGGEPAKQTDRAPGHAGGPHITEHLFKQHFATVFGITPGPGGDRPIQRATCSNSSRSRATAGICIGFVFAGLCCCGGHGPPERIALARLSV